MSTEDAAGHGELQRQNLLSTKGHEGPLRTTKNGNGSQPASDITKKLKTDYLNLKEKLDMYTVAGKLLDLHLSGAAIIERGYRTIPPDWFVDANDADGHVQSWTECFPGVRQKPVALRRGSVLGRAGRGLVAA